MVFKAKKGHKRTHNWVWPMPQTSMYHVRVVAHRESAIIGLFRPCTFFSTKVRQSDVTKFLRKSDIPMIWKGIFKFAQWVRGPKLVLYKWV